MYWGKQCFLSLPKDSEDMSQLEINIMPKDDVQISAFGVFK